MSLVTRIKGRPYSFRRYWWLILCTFPNTKGLEKEFQSHLRVDWNGAKALAALHLFLTFAPLIPFKSIHNSLPLLLLSLPFLFIATAGVIASGYWILFRNT